MQIRKFYGRTASEALLNVKRSLGGDALILETRHLGPGNPEAMANRGARYEICAAREQNPPSVRQSLRLQAETGGNVPGRKTVPPRPVVNRGRSVIEDLAVLRAQVEQLLNPCQSGDEPELGQANRARLDLGDYHALIDQGVDHRVLAPHFRSWLNWRTASAKVRQWLGQVEEGPAAHMLGDSLREWLWRAWMQSMGVKDEVEAGEAVAAGHGVRVMGLVGPTGVGKTTTLAKISSKYRQELRQKSVVITLDTFRFGATEQWKKISHLTGVPVIPIVTQEELSTCMEKWDRFDWVGIDTPGGMTPESPAGRLYGSILAQCPYIETKLVLPATNHESVNREQMARSEAQSGANKVLFSKLDETTRKGSLVNLTLDGRWTIDGVTTGQRVPGDWQPAGSRVLWEHIIAPDGEGRAMGGIA